MASFRISQDFLLTFYLVLHTLRVSCTLVSLDEARGGCSIMQIQGGSKVSDPVKSIYFRIIGDKNHINFDRKSSSFQLICLQFIPHV